MRDRWCIVCLPRSGSTWLEVMLYRQIKSFRLSEYFVYGIYNNPLDKMDFKLNDNNFIEIVDKTNTTLSQDEFYQHRLKILLQADRDQSVTMRMMIAWDSYDYINYLKYLTNLNFKIVILTRNIFDILISQFVSMTLMHPHTFDVKDYETTKLKLLKIDTTEFVRLLNHMKRQEKIQETAALQFKLPTIRYETLIEDCITNNIPIDPEVNVFKTYNELYSDYVENYSELLKIYDNYK